MFERPIKADIDRALSTLMHNARHQLMMERNRINGEAAKSGALQSSRLIVAVAEAANKIHDTSLAQAVPLLRDFVERMQLSPKQITEWAKPHLENLSKSLLGVVPPAGFPNDHRRIVDQYRLAFQQRVDEPSSRAVEA
jgi:hypothetical protein